MQDKFNSLVTDIKKIDINAQPEFIFSFLRKSMGTVFKTGERLPSVRQLSALLKVNYATVHQAYLLAKKCGLIESKPGKGTHFLAQLNAKNTDFNEHDLINMNSPVSEPSFLMIEKLKQQALVAINNYDFKAIFNYKDNIFGSAIKLAGLNWMKKRINQYRLERIIPCAGIHDGLVALFLFYRQKGRIILPEFFYPGIKAIIYQFAVPVVTVVCDSEGPCPDSLEQLAKTGEITALYINPTINNPTTISIGINRKLAIARICKKYQIAILEDDAYGALSSEGIATFSQILPEQTWYLNGLSKSFAPGMRMAWIYAPESLDLTVFLSIMQSMTIMGNPLIYQIVVSWIESGAAYEALAATRKECIRRSERVARLFSGRHFLLAPEGFHLWLDLGEESGLRTALRLQNKGIRVLPCEDFSLNKQGSHLRVSLGGDQTLEELEKSLAKLLIIIDQGKNIHRVNI